MVDGSEVAVVDRRDAMMAAADPSSEATAEVAGAAAC